MITTKPVAEWLSQRMSQELVEDMGIIYGLGVRSPFEPKPDEANRIASQVTAPYQLYWLASRAGIGLHTEMAGSSNWDMTAAVIAAFYSRVRSPQWLPHPESAAITEKAKQTVEGRVLATAAQTLCQTLVASGYRGNFEGSPSEVADAIRAWMKDMS